MNFIEKLNSNRAVTEGNIVPEFKGKIADAATLRNQLLEANFSFGLNGQLNVEFPRKRNGNIAAESNGDLVKRTANAADLLVELLTLDSKEVFASKGRLVIQNPDRDLPFILDRLEIPAKWEAFSKTLGSNAKPGKGATLVSFVEETGHKVPVPSEGFVNKVLHEELREKPGLLKEGSPRVQIPLGKHAQEFLDRDEARRSEQSKSRQR